jgi:hypothetical protein
LKQLAYPLSHQRSVAKWLLITQQKTLSKSLLIANRLVKQLAIPLSNHKTVAKWLLISQQAGKSLVIAMTKHSGFPEFAETTRQNFNFSLPHPERCATVIKYGNPNGS